MPCVSNYDNENPYDIENHGAYKKIKRELDKVTDMLCRTLQAIQLQYSDLYLDEDIQEWEESHKKWDKERNK